jgi:hypothetical protein
MSNFDDIVKAATTAMNRGDLDTAESLVDGLLMKVKHAADDSDDGDPDDWSESADASADGNNASDDDDDGEDDDDDDGEMDKLLRIAKDDHAIIREHVNMSNTVPARRTARQRGYHQQSDNYSTAYMKPPEGPGKRHKFIARAEHIRERDGVSRAESLTRARQEFPETYVDYQDHLARRTTRQQHMVRGWDKVGKAAPDTFQDLCAAELKKSAGSLTHEMAAQRVCQQFGFRAFDHEMYKGESKLTERFEKRVNRLIAEGYSGEDACRLVKQADPLLFKAMQLV